MVYCMSRTLKVRGGIMSQANRYLGGFCSSQRIFPPQIIQVLLVLVETIRPEVAQAGLTAQKLQTDVEWRLRHAGMRVLTDEERRGTPRSPFLYVNMIVYLRPHAFASFH